MAKQSMLSKHLRESVVAFLHSRIMLKAIPGQRWGRSTIAVDWHINSDGLFAPAFSLEDDGVEMIYDASWTKGQCNQFNREWRKFAPKLIKLLVEYEPGSNVCDTTLYPEMEKIWKEEISNADSE